MCTQSWWQTQGFILLASAKPYRLGPCMARLKRLFPQIFTHTSSFFKPDATLLLPLHFQEHLALCLSCSRALYEQKRGADWCHTYTRKRLGEELLLLFYKSALGVGMYVHKAAVLLPPQDVFYWLIYYAFILLRVDRNTLFRLTFTQKSRGGGELCFSVNTRTASLSLPCASAWPGILLQTLL